MTSFDALKTTVRRNKLLGLLAAEKLLLSGMVISLPFVASAQQQATRAAEVDCYSLPSGPSRTDCYIGLSRITRQKGEISAGVAQQIKDSARYHQIIGEPRKTRKHVSKRKSLN